MTLETNYTDQQIAEEMILTADSHPDFEYDGWAPDTTNPEIREAAINYLNEAAYHAAHPE